MNRNETNINDQKAVIVPSTSGKIPTTSVLVQSEDKLMAKTSKEPTCVEKYVTEAQEPHKRKQKRVMKLKRHVSTAMNLSDDLFFHPKKLDARNIILRNGADKKTKLVHELSKQDEMIKAQGQDVTKKYQLLHSDLGKLLRYTSGDVGTPKNSESNSPDRV